MQGTEISMPIRYGQNSMQSTSDKNINETWSVALNKQKIDVVETL